MDLTLLHPKIIHFPIALSIIVPLLATGLTIAWWREWLPRKAWSIAVILQGMLVVSGVASMKTGEEDEEPVEEVVAESIIHEHEEAAELFMWVAGPTFALFLLVGFIRDEKNALRLATAATAASFVVAGLSYRVGEAGGELVYEHGAASAHTGELPATVDSEHDDD